MQRQKRQQMELFSRRWWTTGSSHPRADHCNRHVLQYWCQGIQNLTTLTSWIRFPDSRTISFRYSTFTTNLSSLQILSWKRSRANIWPSKRLPSRARAVTKSSSSSGFTQGAPIISSTRRREGSSLWRRPTSWTRCTCSGNTSSEFLTQVIIDQWWSIL